MSKFEKLPLKELMIEIKQQKNPGDTFQRVLAISDEKWPSEIWARLEYSIESDIMNAKKWLSREFKVAENFTGLYLGLDTLNMDGAKGHNVEIGFSNKCKIANTKSDEWIFDLDRYGTTHLIKGLHSMHRQYNHDDRYDSDTRWFVEFVLFLAYSGIVLGAALQTVKHKGDFLAKWGYHDGDMFWLARKTRTVVELIPA